MIVINCCLTVSSIMPSEEKHKSTHKEITVLHKNSSFYKQHRGQMQSDVWLSIWKILDITNLKSLQNVNGFDSV